MELSSIQSLLLFLMHLWVSEIFPYALMSPGVGQKCIRIGFFIKVSLYSLFSRHAVVRMHVHFLRAAHRTLWTGSIVPQCLKELRTVITGVGLPYSLDPTASTY